MTTTKPKTMCSEEVYHHRGSVGFGRMYPCKRAATVERDGKHYCTQHDPERIAELLEVWESVEKAGWNWLALNARARAEVHDAMEDEGWLYEMP